MSTLLFVLGAHFVLLLLPSSNPHDNGYATHIFEPNLCTVSGFDPFSVAEILLTGSRMRRYCLEIPRRDQQGRLSALGSTLLESSQHSGLPVITAGLTDEYYLPVLTAPDCLTELANRLTVRNGAAFSVLSHNIKAPLSLEDTVLVFLHIKTGHAPDTVFACAMRTKVSKLRNQPDLLASLLQAGLVSHDP